MALTPPQVSTVVEPQCDFFQLPPPPEVSNELVVRLPTLVGQVAEPSLDDYVPLQLSASCLGTCSTTFPVDPALLSFAPETT